MAEHIWKTWKAWFAKNKFKILAACVGSLMVLVALFTGHHVSRKSTIARIKKRKEARGLQAELQYLDEVAQSAKKQADVADARLERRKAELDREIKKWDAERIAKEFRERGYWMRQKHIFLCILCLLCGAQTNASAQSGPYTQQVTQPLTLNGQEGVWLPKDKAVKLLTDVSLLAPTRQALTAQKDLANALNNKIRVITALQDAWKDIALHQPKKSWWENSSVLMCAGFVTGALLVVGLTALVQQGSH